MYNNCILYFNKRIFEAKFDLNFCLIPCFFLGITDSGSPYPPMGLAMPSPGSRQWPGSPSMPGPSPVQRFGMAQSPGSMGATTHSPGSSGVTGQQGQVGEWKSFLFCPSPFLELNMATKEDIDILSIIMYM